jgi:TonB family protein
VQGSCLAYYVDDFAYAEATIGSGSKTPDKGPCVFFCNKTALGFKKVDFHIVEDKRYHVKALLVSLIAHVSVLLIFLSMGDRVIQANKPIVIDFSIEESGSAGTGSSESKTIVPENKRRGTVRKGDVKGMEPQMGGLENVINASKEESILDVSTDVEHMSVIETPERPALFPVTENVGSTNERHTLVTSASAGISPGSSKVLSGGGSNTGGMRTGMVGASGDGFGGVGHGGRTRYLRENFSYIRDMIQKRVVYPNIARQMGWQGRVKVSFIIFADGFAKDVNIIQTSGVEVLDRSAMKAVKDASPFPKPPCEAQIIIPVVYKLN